MADKEFGELKRLFISALILSFPEPSRQFVVEVDALGLQSGGGPLPEVSH